jgi:hypothetical protein
MHVRDVRCSSNQNPTLHWNAISCGSQSLFLLRTRVHGGLMPTNEP